MVSVVFVVPRNTGIMVFKRGCFKVLISWFSRFPCEKRTTPFLNNPSSTPNECEVSRGFGRLSCSHIYISGSVCRPHASLAEPLRTNTYQDQRGQPTGLCAGLQLDSPLHHAVALPCNPLFRVLAAADCLRNKSGVVTVALQWVCGFLSVLLPGGCCRVALR